MEVCGLSLHPLWAECGIPQAGKSSDGRFPGYWQFGHSAYEFEDTPKPLTMLAPTVDYDDVLPALTAAALAVGAR